MKTVLFALGGTGGHVFPALALAEELSKNPSLKIVFAGSNLPSNPYFQISNFKGYHIPSPPLNKKMLFSFPFFFVKGFFQSLFFLKNHSPDLILGFGSYHTATLMTASLFFRTPFALFDSNSYPGVVNRLFSYFSKKNFITFEKAAPFLKSPSLLIEPPIRDSIKNPLLSKEDSRKALGLKEGLFTFLVFGGSQGAKILNHETSLALLSLKKKGIPFQVYHLTGSLESTEIIGAFYKKEEILAKVVPFEKKMELAWQSADLAITRGGALTLFESAATKTPLIIVPLPSAKEDHQTKNAEAFIEEYPASILVKQDKNLFQNLEKALFSLDLNNFKDIKQGSCYFKTKKPLPSLEESVINLFNL